MARKKIVFVIVEGPSDDSALGVILNRLYDKNTVHVEITHGDITSESTAKPENIASKVGNIVKAYARLSTKATLISFWKLGSPFFLSLV